jgi:hypothetical protein
MNEKDRAVPHDVQQRWREWAEKEPAIDERQLRRNLLNQIVERRPRTRARLVLVAVAASVLAVLIGFETIRKPPAPHIAEESAVGYEIDEGVILILREGKEPIYVLTGSTRDDEGVRQ